VNVPWRTCDARKTATERKPFGVFFSSPFYPLPSLSLFFSFFISIQPACASGNNAASRGRAEYQRARPVCSTFLHACPTCNLFARSLARARALYPPRRVFCAESIFLARLKMICLPIRRTFTRRRSAHFPRVSPRFTGILFKRRSISTIQIILDARARASSSCFLSRFVISEEYLRIIGETSKRPRPTPCHASKVATRCCTRQRSVFARILIAT